MLLSGEMSEVGCRERLASNPTPRFALPLPFKEWEGSWGTCSTPV
jgi:hypothetical protein